MRVIAGNECFAAISWLRLGVSTPKKHGHLIMGLADSKYTFLAPAFFKALIK